MEDKEKRLCEHCGADKQDWLETFGEIHSCPGTENEGNQQAYRVMNLLKTHGVDCFLPEDVLDSDIEGLIKGHD